MKISVVGSGAFGTALATHLVKKEYSVKLWSFEEKVTEEVNKLHQNLTFLPEVKLPPQLEATSSLEEVFSYSEIVVNATPIFAIGSTFKNKDLAGKILINASKGIERKTHKLVHEIFQGSLQGEFSYCALSGPSFALELARGLNTAVTIASVDSKVRKTVKEIFESKTFKVQENDDVVATELGGALKNVLAIASGLVIGAGLGKDLQAVLFCEGLEEMISLGEKMGAKRESFYTYSGIGDLFLTSTSDQSRNFNFGFRLGQGESVEQASSGKTVEGIGTAESAYTLAQKFGVKAKLFQEVYAIIFANKEPKRALQDLWSEI